MLFTIRLFSLLPLSVLYAMADCILYPIMYYVIRYRRDIVRKNLRLSFPEKSNQELRQLEHRFYHHFADTIVEIIYGYRISDKEIHQRFQFENGEMVEQLLHEKKGLFLLMGHLGNWEWAADFARRYSDPNIAHYNVYRRLKNSNADQAMLTLRAKRGGSGCIEKSTLLRHLVALRHSGKPVSIGLISDQKPSPHSAHIWTTFLHQDTAFLDGAEVLAQKFDYAVIYIHISSPKRGYYKGRFEVITTDPKNTNNNEITLTFAQLLEQNIIEQPELWLWSHNRWKWSRTDSASTHTHTT